MDPVTAAILIGLAITSTAISVDQNNKKIKAANESRKLQDKLRIDTAAAEIGAVQQKTQLALGNAASRPKNGMAPSFAAAALLGNQSSNASGGGGAAAPVTNPGSSGTF